MGTARELPRWEQITPHFVLQETSRQITLVALIEAAEFGICAAICHHSWIVSFHQDIIGNVKVAALVQCGCSVNKVEEYNHFVRGTIHSVVALIRACSIVQFIDHLS